MSKEPTKEHESGELTRTFTFTYLTDSLLEDDERLDGYDVLTALGIAFYVDKGRTGWPGKKAIARIARISERKVQECIGNLEEYGYLSIKRRKDPEKPNKNLSNLYVLHDLPQVKEGGGAHDALGYSTPCPRGGAHGATELYSYNYNQEQQPPVDDISQESREEEEDTGYLNIAMSLLDTYGVHDNSSSRDKVSRALANGLTGDEVTGFFKYLFDLAKHRNNIENKAGWVLSQFPLKEKLEAYRRANKPEPIPMSTITMFDIAAAFGNGTRKHPSDFSAEESAVCARLEDKKVNLDGMSKTDFILSEVERERELIAV